MSRFSFSSLICYPDAPSVSLILPGEASLWACGSLYEYFSDHITFQTASYRVVIEGEELVLKAMSQSEVLIHGRITGVRCEELGR